MSGTSSPYLGRDDAAAYLGVARKTLEKWAVTGDGPPFRKHGRRVLYHRDEMDAWSEAQTRQSTSDPGPEAL